MKLTSFFNLNIAQDSLDTALKTLELTKLVDTQNLPGASPSALKLIDLIKSTSESPVVEPALKAAEAVIPFIKVLTALLDMYKKRNDPTTYHECLTLCIFRAYLERLDKYYAEIDESTILNRITAIKQEVESSLSEEDIEESFAYFPKSKLAENFNQASKSFLVERNVPEDVARLIIERAIWDTPNYIIKYWKDMPEAVRGFGDASISEWKKQSKSISEINKYLKKVKEDTEQPAPQTGEGIRLKDVYIELQVKEEHVRRKSLSTANRISLHQWVNDILKKEDREKIIFLQGNSGQGKTAFCKIFCDLTARELYPSFIPVFIRLQDVKSIKENLQDTLNSCLSTIHFFNENKYWLTDESRRFLILLDGLDELEVEQQDIETLVEQVLELQQSGVSQFLITSRNPISQELEKLFYDQSYWGVIQPMDNTQQNKWVERWTTANLLLERGQGLTALRSHFEQIKTLLDSSSYFVLILFVLHLTEKEKESDLIESLSQSAISDSRRWENIQKKLEKLSREKVFEGLNLPVDIGPNHGEGQLLKEIVLLAKRKKYESSNISHVKTLFEEGLIDNIIAQNEERLKLTQYVGQLRETLNKVVRYCSKNDIQEQNIKLGELCYFLVERTEKIEEIKKFLTQDLPSDISQDLAREPFLLYLLVLLFQEKKISAEDFSLSEAATSRIIIYKKSIEESLGRMRQSTKSPKKSNLQISDEAFHFLLEEIAAYATQCGEKAISPSSLMKILDQEPKLSNEIKEKTKKVRVEETIKNLFPSLLEFSKDSEGNIELRFTHKSFREFLLTQKLVKLFKKWSLSSNGSYELSDLSFDQEVYTYLGYGKLNSEILKYLNSFFSEMKSEGFEFELLFRRFNDFYLRWCESSHLTFNQNLSDQAVKAPWHKLAERQQSGGLSFNPKNSDIYVGVNIVILLLELHRYSKENLEPDSYLDFHPCQDSDVSKNGRENLLRVIGYCHCIPEYLSEKASFRGFVNAIDASKKFLSKVNLDGAILKGVDFSEANLEGVSLREADLSRADLGRANLKNANLSSAILRMANLEAIEADGIDLSGANLEGANLAGIDFSNARGLSGVVLTSANLQGSTLKGLNLSSSTLIGQDLSKFDLSGTDLSGANLKAANLSGTDLTLIKCLQNAVLTNANLRGSDLRGIDLSGSVLVGQDLSGFDLTNANFNRANLEKANLSGIDFTSIKLIFKGANLKGANLSKSNLEDLDLTDNFDENEEIEVPDISFCDADLSSAKLARSQLAGLSFENANLQYADLSDVDAREANFEGANLSDVIFLKADISNANLVNTNLSNADLSGADLRGTDLSGANLSGVNLEEIKFNERTRWREALGVENATNLPAAWQSEA